MSGDVRFCNNVLITYLVAMGDQPNISVSSVIMNCKLHVHQSCLLVAHQAFDMRWMTSMIRFYYSIANITDVLCRHGYLSFQVVYE